MLNPGGKALHAGSTIIPHFPRIAVNSCVPRPERHRKMLNKQGSGNEKPMWLKDFSQFLFSTKLPKVPSLVESRELLAVF